VTATHWKDPSSYVLEHTDLFPAVGIVEDPHVYLDAGGHFHALFHHEIGCPPKSWTARNINCGGHAFSEDGRRWFYGSAAGGRANGTAGLDEGLLALSVPIIVYMENPYVDKKLQ
jgi:hypothetical protein